jgi:polysaccharide export outer membrane protein
MWTRSLQWGLSVLIAAVFAASGAGQFARADEVSAPQAERPPYLIQPGDILVVSVWKERDLQSEALVTPDGGLSFPLAGDVQASGHTVDEVRAAIAERIRAYIPDAVVTVAVKEIGGNRIYVLGKVNRPGEFPLVRPIDVMQALSLAGGTTAYASLNDIIVLRRKEGRQIAIPFRYGEVARGRELAQNIQLQSGDTVVVP